jgi:hypothetical protein
VPVAGQPGRVEIRPRRDVGFEAGVARVQASLVHRQHLIGVLGAHGADGEPDRPDEGGKREDIRIGQRRREPAHQAGRGGEAVHAGGIDAVVAGGATALGEHEPHRGQDLQVLRDGGLADLHGRDDLAHLHRAAVPGKQGHDLDPGAVGQRPEPGRVVLGLRSCYQFRTAHRAATLNNDRGRVKTARRAGRYGAGRCLGIADGQRFRRPAGSP